MDIEFGELCLTDWAVSVPLIDNFVHTVSAEGVVAGLQDDLLVTLLAGLALDYPSEPIQLNFGDQKLLLESLVFRIRTVLQIDFLDIF